MWARVRSSSGSRNCIAASLRGGGRLAAAAAAPEMPGEKLAGTLGGKRGSLRVVARALVAVEAVARALVNVERGAGRGRRLDALAVALWNALVRAAEVIHNRAPGPAVEVIRDSAVIHDGAGERQLAGRKIGERAAPAVADDAGPAGVLHDRRACCDVLESGVGLDLPPVADALLRVCRGVAELDTAAHPVEQARRDGGVALGGEAVGDRADVGVDPVDLLHHHHRAARLGLRGHQPRLKRVTVARHDGGELAHGTAAEWLRRS